MFQSQADSSHPLREPDAILKPNIEMLVSNFIEEGGDTNDLIDYLANGYVGKLHKLDILGSLMSKHGIDFRQNFRNSIQKKIYQMFKPEAFDYLVLDPMNIPKWIDELIESKFWISVIFPLLERYPQSSFLIYCISQVCLKHPENIESAPPYVLRLDAFQNLIRNYIENFSPENQTKLINILTSDTRTAMEAAFLFDRNTQFKLIQQVEVKLSQNITNLHLFQRILMKLDGWSSNIINAYFGIVPLLPEHITEFRDYANRSNYSKDLVFRKISASLLDPNVSNQTTEEIIKFLSEVTEIDVDMKLYTTGINSLRKWTFNEAGDLWSAFQILKNFIIASNALDMMKYLAKTNKLAISDGHLNRSPEIDILKEIMYWHPQLRNKAFDVYTLLYEGIRGKTDQYKILMYALYENLHYMFGFGLAIKVLHFLRKKKEPLDSSRELQFYITLFPLLRPPYSDEFLLEFARTLDSTRVRTIMYPLSNMKPAPIQVTVLRYLIGFVQDLNKLNILKGKPKEAVMYDDLRHAAMKALR